MLVVETIAKIRRVFFKQGKPIKAIWRELGVSRKVVRGPPITILTPAALTLRHEPVADCARYDNLRRTV